MKILKIMYDYISDYARDRNEVAIDILSQSSSAVCRVLAKFRVIFSAYIENYSKSK